MRAKPESVISSYIEIESEYLIVLVSEINIKYCTKTLKNVRWKSFF